MRAQLFLILLTITGCHTIESTRPIVREYIGADYAVFETDSVRTYFAPRFSDGLMGWGENPKPYQDYYSGQLTTLGPLFRNGQLTGEMFHTAMLDSTHAVEPFAHPGAWSEQASTFGESYTTEMAQYNGPLLKILLVERHDTLDYTRLYISATTDRTEDGWGGMLRYTLDVQGDRVLGLRYAGLQ